MLLLKNVEKSFQEPGGGRLPILDVPSFQVEAGEQMVLLGPSGSGKTTLLHVVSGITNPDRGEITIDGARMDRLSEEGRDLLRANKIGYVFQTFNLLDAFNAEENVILGSTFARSIPNPRRRALGLLERVGLGHRLKHKPSELSVGEQQRVAVARALANQPRLLLADEPTANVDPRNKRQIVDLIRETCREEDIALVLVTHDMEVAEQFERVDHLPDINRAAQTADAGASGSEASAE